MLPSDDFIVSDHYPDREGGSPWPLLSSLLRDFEGSRPSLAGEIVEQIRAALPFYRDGSAATPASLLVSCSAHVKYMTEVTTSDLGASQTPHALGLERGRAGVPLAQVLAAYRIGSHLIWERIAAFARETDGSAADHFVELASEVWSVHDEFARALEAGWHEARHETLLRNHQERSSLVDLILRSTGDGPAELWEAVDRLGLPRTSGYIVVVARVEQPGIDPLPNIERLLQSRRITSAWLMRSELLAGVVATVAPNTEDVLARTLVDSGVTCGISPRRVDYAEGAQSFRLAAAAAAASALGSTTRFQSAPLSVTVAAAPDIARQAASEVLGQVLALPEEESTRLLQTLRAWFDSDGSTAATARALFLHPNTIRNRIRRAEMLMKRRITAPTDIAEIALALDALRLTPRRVPEAGRER